MTSSYFSDKIITGINEVYPTQAGRWVPWAEYDEKKHGSVIRYYNVKYAFKPGMEGTGSGQADMTAEEYRAEVKRGTVQTIDMQA